MISKINIDEKIKSAGSYLNSVVSRSNGGDVQSVAPTTVLTLTGATMGNAASELRKRRREEIAKKYDNEIKNGKMYYTLFKNPVYYYNQGDFNQEVCSNPVDGKSHTIASSGCGIVSMSMVISTFLKRNIEPTEIGETAYKTGSFTGDGMGTHIEKIPDTLSEYGLNATLVGNDALGRKQVEDALKSNNSMVIVNVGPGNFTKYGHYMVLADMNNSDQVYVLDPNCNPEKHPERGNTNRYYNFDYICSEVQTSVDKPFIIVSE